MWAIGAAIPWLVVAVAQMVWFALDGRLPWLHVRGGGRAPCSGVAVFVVVVPLWRYRVHRWDIGPRRCTPGRAGWCRNAGSPRSRGCRPSTPTAGPLDRLFGLANVTVTTASSAGAVRIVALDSDVADRVVAQLTDIAAHRRPGRDVTGAGPATGSG